MQPPLGILIAGTSHVGKSTFAGALAQALGRELISTDDLARHPGRPWPTLRPEVAEYYAGLSDGTIHWFLKVHHENLWPRIEQIIDARRQRATPFVLEGAALRPEYIARLKAGIVRPLLLHGDDGFLRRRMTEAAGPQHGDPARAIAIGKFIERSIRENGALLTAARDLDIRCVDVAIPGALDALMQELLAASADPG